uniref:protein-tyrosine-phosphatase n=1 Tax=Cynoglossus semilaevis TaxID=244447 RepID=A0A3P8UQP3_CYNSE
MLNKSKSSSRFSLFSPPWNSSSESESNPPSRSGSKKLRNYSRRAATGPAGARGPDTPEPKPSGPEHFQYSEPVISKVTDYIYVGNLNAAYNGWSRLKVDIGDVPDALGDGPSLKQRCFEDINECIDASTEKRKRVLVHCRDGFSLAPTCIIQYLMVKQNMRLIAAYELLRAKYPVNIRECHQNVLVSLERALRPGGSTNPETVRHSGLHCGVYTLMVNGVVVLSVYLI